MVFPRALPSGKPSSLGETFHHVTPTSMEYLYNVQPASNYLDTFFLFPESISSSSSSPGEGGGGTWVFREAHTFVIKILKKT